MARPEIRDPDRIQFCEDDDGLFRRGPMAPEAILFWVAYTIGVAAALFIFGPPVFRAVWRFLKHVFLGGGE